MNLVRSLTGEQQKESVDRKNISIKIRKAIAVAKAALDIFVAIKRKDPVYTGMSMLSTYEALDALFTNDNIEEVDNYIRSKHLVRRGGPGTAGIISFLLDDYEIYKETVVLSNEDKLFKYMIDDEPIFIKDKKALYMKSEDVDYIELIFNKIGNKIGNQITLELDKQTGYAKLKKTSINTENYVQIVNVEKYCDTILKFKNNKIKRSSLLSGLPGSGKTTFSVKASQILNGKLLILPSKSVNFIMDYEINIVDIVNVIKPSIILFDDIDRTSEYYMDNLLDFIENLNRMDNETVIMATVNDLNRLPNALKRPGRFDEIIEFDYPSEDNRRIIIKKYLNFYGTRLSDKNVEFLVENTENLTPAYIKEIVIQSTIQPMDKMTDIIEHIKKFTRS